LIHLEAVVYTDRTYLGRLMCHTHDEQATFLLCAQSDPALGIAHPCAGNYRLRKIVPLSPQRTAERLAYGPALLFFVPQEPTTRQAERQSRARFLSLHGGVTDRAGRLLPTAGCLRVADEALTKLLTLIGDVHDVTLHIREERLGFFRRFLRYTPRVSKQPALTQRRSAPLSEGREDDDAAVELSWDWTQFSNESSVESSPDDLPLIVDPFHNQGEPSADSPPAREAEGPVEERSPQEPFTPAGAAGDITAGNTAY